MSSDDWADGPRPSFYGQLRKDAHSGHPRLDDSGSAPSQPDAATTSQRDGGWTELLDDPPTGPGVLEDQREAFVHRQLEEAFVTERWQRRLLAIVTTLVIGVICWRGQVPALYLAAWVGIRLALAVAWRKNHGARDWDSPASAARAKRRRQVILAFLSGSVLGASVLLFFGRIPIGLQFVCWMVLAASVTLPVHSMALNAALMRTYVHAFFVTAFVCLFYRVFTADARLAEDISEAHQHYEAWFIVIPLVQWVLITRIADQVLANARKGFELAFYKGELIQTLAEQRRRAEEAVLTRNRFIATAAHDVRQPVVALSIYVDHLMEVPTDQAAVMPKIAKATAAVSRLFDTLFDLSRMDHQQLKVRNEPLNIAEVMEDLRDQYEPVARAEEVELRMRTVRSELTSDPVLVRRMIGNVVSNAIKFTPPGKKVLISARTRGPTVLVEVWDQGVGIAPAELRKVFLEFYKVAGAGENAEGFGLGLSIVARLAHVLDTRLSVRSRPGRGTVFRMCIGVSKSGVSARGPQAQPG
jgi:signal transduction histidine kinase